MSFDGMSTGPASYVIGQIWVGKSHPALGAGRREIITVEPTRVKWRDAECHEYACWSDIAVFARWAEGLEVVGRTLR